MIDCYGSVDFSVIGVTLLNSVGARAILGLGECCEIATPRQV
jgi:hypothetical protein